MDQSYSEGLYLDLGGIILDLPCAVILTTPNHSADWDERCLIQRILPFSVQCGDAHSTLATLNIRKIVILQFQTDALLTRAVKIYSGKGCGRHLCRPTGPITFTYDHSWSLRPYHLHACQYKQCRPDGSFVITA